MIIFGQRASKIGEFDINETTCSYCEKENSQHVSIYGKYAHVFWIPVFPFGKKAVAECKHCKRTYEQSEFTPELKSKYKEAKKNVKTPIWHWLGLMLVFGLLILIKILVNLEIA